MANRDFRPHAARWPHRPPTALEYEARRGRNDAYFTATSDQTGQFTLNNVPPGSYKLFAWEDIPAGAYQYPDFLRRYEDLGQVVTVTPNGTITANAKLIPAG